MPRTESAEKYYRENHLPGIALFHKEHPLDWAGKEAGLMDDARRKQAQLAIQTSRDTFSDVANQSNFREEVQEPIRTFEDATNVWKRNPDLSPDEKMSIEGKWYLEDIIWVFKRVKKTLIDSNGTQLIEEPLIADKPLSAYLEMLKEKLRNREEFDYISGIVDQLQAALRNIQQELLSVPKPTDSSEPDKTILEMLEDRQNAGARQRFTTVKGR